MKYGNNTVSFLVTDVSGSDVSGLTGFTVQGIVGNTPIESATITNISGGVYNASFNVPVIGQGFIRFINSPHTVYPALFNIQTEMYSTDDVYASIARQTLDITQVNISNYETQSVGPYKEGDDVLIDYVVPTAIAPSLSGYSNFKASIYNSEVLTSASGAGWVCDFIINSVSNNTVQLLMPAISGATVSDGLTEEYFYSDLEAKDEDGYKKTLAEFKIKLRRNITR